MEKGNSELFLASTACRYEILTWMLNRGIFFLTTSLVGILMWINTAKNGPDFAVYWKSVRLMLEGEPLYSVARDGIMVFKYPPWIAPFFIPFSLMSFDGARVAWGAIEFFSLLALSDWVIRKAHVGAQTASFVMLLFLGIWQVHAFNGQVSLPIAALSVWLFEMSDIQGSRKSFRSVAGKVGLFLALSTKIVSLFPLLGYLRPYLKLRVILICPAVLITLSQLIFCFSKESWIEVLRSWATAMGPGVHPVTGEPLITVSGREAQGLVSGLFKVFNLPYNATALIAACTLVVAAVLAWAWSSRSKNIGAREQFAGWLALGVTAQPLAGFHAFAMAFPLAVIAMDRAWKSRERRTIGFSLFGVLAISVMTQKTMGSLGSVLEMISIKSLGVLILCWVISSAAKARNLSRPK